MAAMHTWDPETLAGGVAPKDVWAAGWRVLELPPSER
jgi:hypothetical protein